jgi:hypothetical protein
MNRRARVKSGENWSTLMSITPGKALNQEPCFCHCEERSLRQGNLLAKEEIASRRTLAMTGRRREEPERTSSFARIGRNITKIILFRRDFLIMLGKTQAHWFGR